MARFSGNVGFGVESLKTSGVFEDVITVRPYKGDFVRNVSTFHADEEILGEVAASKTISILADLYAIEHSEEIRFAEWDGDYWVVTQVETLRPRLTLTLGGAYNGPKG